MAVSKSESNFHNIFRDVNRKFNVEISDRESDTNFVLTPKSPSVCEIDMVSVNNSPQYSES